MRPLLTILLLLMFNICLCGQEPSTEALSPQSREVLGRMEEKIQAIVKRAKSDMVSVVEAAGIELQAEQERLTRAGDLDGALAVRTKIRSLKEVPDKALAPPPASEEIRRDPGNLGDYSKDYIGESFLFEITGADFGSIWGTDYYSSDSTLAVACVHAGLLKIGEKGVIRVTLQAARRDFRGTTRNGIASQSYQFPRICYTLEKVSQ